jgi:hypothetical protein
LVFRFLNVMHFSTPIKLRTGLHFPFSRFGDQLKYSFTNEKTDYTYAHTYNDYLKDPKDVKNVDMPNLCRRSLHNAYQLTKSQPTENFNDSSEKYERRFSQISNFVKQLDIRYFYSFLLFLFISSIILYLNFNYNGSNTTSISNSFDHSYLKPFSEYFNDIYVLISSVINSLIDFFLQLFMNMLYKKKEINPFELSPHEIEQFDEKLKKKKFYISFESVEKYIKQSLNLYNYEKSGMTDFASEMMGGCILFTKCTEDFDGNPRWLTFFGFRVSKFQVSARVVIQVRYYFYFWFFVFFYQR